MIDDPHRSGDPRADRRADYAESYAKSGDHAAAVDLMRQAVELAPGWTLGRMRLAAFLEEAGDRDAAGAVYAAVRAEDEADPYGAGLKLASLGRAPVPVAPPPAFVAGLFDQYAEGFEAALVKRLGYRVPDTLAEAIRDVAGGRRFAAVLDLGCGTGLMGERLRPICDRLEGIDLSAGMLQRARRKKIYDRLVEGDILDAWADKAVRYDLVTAADVLNYLGDLAPVFARVASVQKSGDLFAFSVEADDGADGFALRPSLRYAHAPAHVVALLDAAGFAPRSQRRAELRQDRGEPVAGALFVAERR